MRHRLLYPVVLIIVVLFLVIFPAGHAHPRGIQSAGTSLHQSGENLVWDLHLEGHGSWDDELALGDRPCLDLSSGAIHEERLCLGLIKGAIVLVHGGDVAEHPRSVPATVPVPTTFTGADSGVLTVTFRASTVRIGNTAVAWQSSAPTRSAGSLTLHTPRLVGCTASGPDWVFNGSTHSRDVALTFDDGPSPDPTAMDFVDVLAKYHAPATFFEIGDQIATFDSDGTAERAMLANGDMIGDHTWNHPDMTKLTPAAQRAELEQASTAIQQKTGFTPCLFRAPYGDVDPGLLTNARSLGFATIQWNVDTADWSLPGTRSIIHTATADAKNGAIIIMHFGGGVRTETLDALPRMIKDLRAAGYHLVTVTQMLGYHMIYR